MKFFLIFATVLITILISSSNSHAFNLEVGGTKGWTLNPPESYSAWAHRLRFSVNDTLYFRYNAATDSVLVVNKDDYDKCNSNNPITKLDGGNSTFTFDRSGPFFFITGNKSNCDQGQKIHIVVLAIRNKQLPLPSHSASAPTIASSGDANSTPTYAPALSSARETYPFVIMLISLAFAFISLAFA